MTTNKKVIRMEQYLNLSFVLSSPLEKMAGTQMKMEQ